MPTQGMFEVARKGKNLGVEWMKNNRDKLSQVQVRLDPVGFGTIRMIFSCPQGCEFSEEQKEFIKSFLQNGFKEKIKPILNKLGWMEFRIRTCPRDQALSMYRWYIEDRTK